MAEDLLNSSLFPYGETRLIAIATMGKSYSMTLSLQNNNK